MLVLAILGCETLEPFFREVREPSETVSLQGWVYDSPFPETNDDVMTEGTVSFTDSSGELLAEGDQPYDSYPGYWRAQELPGERYDLRIDGGEGWYPAVWLGTTPTGSGYWSGLFGFEAEVVDPFFESFEEGYGLSIGGVDDGLVHLWGSPWDPDAVRGDQISVEDAEGNRAAVLSFVVDDEGLLAETDGAPVDYFFAFNLPAGDVTVSIENDDAEVEREVYFAEGGDIVAAWYFQGP